MVFHANNQRRVPQGAMLQWVMQGLPNQNANKPFTLGIEYVRLPNGKTGIALDPNTTILPADIDVYGREYDVTIRQGRVVWLTGMNGMMVSFEGRHYVLIQIMDVKDDLSEGILYFHIYPPVEYGGGDIVYSNKQHLE